MKITHVEGLNAIKFAGMYRKSLRLKTIFKLKTTATLKDIMIEVAYLFKVTPESLKGRSRKMPLPYARKVAWWITNHKMGGRTTYGEIGKLYDRDHSTVLIGIKRLNDRLSVDKDFKKDFDKIIEKLC